MPHLKSDTVTIQHNSEYYFLCEVLTTAHTSAVQLNLSLLIN